MRNENQPKETPIQQSREQEFPEKTEALVESAETAFTVLAQSMRIVRGIAGSKIANGVMKQLEHLSKVKGFKVISRFKPYQVARLVIALGCATDAGQLTQERLINALQSVHTASRVEMQLRSTELAPLNKEKRDTAVQVFLDDIRPHVETIRKEYGNSGDPTTERALRVAFSNIFLPFENKITVGKFQDSEEYNTELPKLLGAPIGIDDLFDYQPEHAFGEKVSLKDGLNEDGTPKAMPIGHNPIRSETYVAFKRKVFEIYNTPAFKALQRRIGDTEILLDYEVLIDPDLAPPELLAEVRERAKLGPILNFVNPKTLGYT